MLCKDPVEAVGLFQCPAQGIEVFLVCILHPGAAHTVHTSLVLCQFVLIPEHGGDILRGRQNTPNDGFAQGHFGRNAAVEQFFSHVPVIVEVADTGSRQPQQFGVGAEFQKFLHLFPPALRACPVKFVHNNVSGVQGGNLLQLLRRAPHQLGIGEEMDLRQRKIRVLLLQALDLCFKDILTGRQPQESRIGVVLDQLEGYIALASAGGMDDGSLAVLRQHDRGSLISLCVMFK